MKRFLPWLVPIIILLAGIPFLLIYKVTIVAKIAGVIVVVLTTLAIRFWMYRAGKQRKRLAKVKFTANERFFLDSQFPYYKVMSSAEKKRLEESAGILLAEISFDRFDRKDPGKDECLAFAMVMALLVKEEPYTSCAGKVVVFTENDTPEMILQGNQPVLFIGESQVKAILASVHSPVIAEKPGEAIREILLRFYRTAV